MSEEAQNLDSLYDNDDQAQAVTPAEPAAPAAPETPPTPAATPPDPPATPAEPAAAPTTPAAESDDTRPGLERYLAEYGIEGGMIAFEDGEKVHIDDLSPAEQHVVLNSLATKSRPTVEQSLDLNEDEINFLNMVRESGKGVADVVADLANKQLTNIRDFEDSQSIDYEKMSDDAIYLAFLQGKNSELSTEELQDDLEKAKETRTYDTVVTGLRADFKKSQEMAKATQDTKASQEFNAEIEKDRATIVSDIAPVKEIAGFELTDDHKNELLGDILELNDVGDSLLLEKIFSTPQTILEAAWFQKYGKDSINQMENYWKQEASKAYARGKAEALGKLPEGNTAPRLSGTRNRANQPIADGFNAQPDAKELDDLYND